jgi:1,2-phenylacetyl-CoA epoxidase PaaB subunit
MTELDRAADELAEIRAAHRWAERQVTLAHERKDNLQKIFALESAARDSRMALNNAEANFIKLREKSR